MFFADRVNAAESPKCQQRPEEVQQRRLKNEHFGKLQQSALEMIVLWRNNLEGSKMQYK